MRSRFFLIPLSLSLSRGGLFCLMFLFLFFFFSFCPIFPLLKPLQFFFFLLFNLYFLLVFFHLTVVCDFLKVLFRWLRRNQFQYFLSLAFKTQCFFACGNIDSEVFYFSLKHFSFFEFSVQYRICLEQRILYEADTVVKCAERISFKTKIIKKTNMIINDFSAVDTKNILEGPICL